jgi:hypothetical protein
MGADHKQPRDVYQRHADKLADMIYPNNNNDVSSEEPEPPLSGCEPSLSNRGLFFCLASFADFKRLQEQTLMWMSGLGSVAVIQPNSSPMTGLER